MLMDGQESPVYIISDALYRYMSETIYDMCDLPELPVLTEDTIQSITVEGTASTLLRPLGTETDEDTGTETVTWAAGGEDVTELESTGDLLSDLEGISLTKCVDYKPTDEAAELCGFSAPRAVVTGPLPDGDRNGELSDADLRQRQSGWDRLLCARQRRSHHLSGWTAATRMPFSL